VISEQNFRILKINRKLLLSIRERMSEGQVREKGVIKKEKRYYY
jgi:hypothetical protein